MLDKAFEEFEEHITEPEISMTPLIDMIFILLIFFVVTTTFTKESGILVNKAESETAVLIDNDMLLVSISKEGAYWSEERKRSLDETVSLIVQRANSNEKLTIVITPDKESQVEPLITLIDKLQKEEITRFTIGTKQVAGNE